MMLGHQIMEISGFLGFAKYLIDIVVEGLEVLGWNGSHHPP